MASHQSTKNVEADYWKRRALEAEQFGYGLIASEEALKTQVTDLKRQLKEARSTLKLVNASLCKSDVKLRRLQHEKQLVQERAKDAESRLKEHEPERSSQEQADVWRVQAKARVLPLHPPEMTRRGRADRAAELH